MLTESAEFRFPFLASSFFPSCSLFFFFPRFLFVVVILCKLEIFERTRIEVLLLSSQP